MTLVDSSQVHITSEVYDFMFIRIDSPEIETHALRYSIVGNNGEIIRKGFFRGTIIQLRLAHLADGAYRLVLNNNEGVSSIDHAFTKRTPLAGQQTSFSF